MGKLFYLKCAVCKHEVDLHSRESGRCTGYLDGEKKPVGGGTIKAGWDYCNCTRTRVEIEKAAESRRFIDLEREGA